MSARILIIEDNPANLELMTYLLNAFGHTVLFAEDGEKGLATARREKLDLIICDIQLPGMDGYAVVYEMKKEEAIRAIPLVAVTALAMVGDRHKVLAGGFDGYISKPIDPETFLAQVEVFLPSKQCSPWVPPVTLEPQATSLGPIQARILVVDDRPINLCLKRSILEPLDYALITANGMREGLKLARNVPLDLIVSDVDMSEGSGFDFIRAIKADNKLKYIPLIFLTSTCCNEQSRAAGLALGADRFLFRPIEPQDLLNEIQACLMERKPR